MSTMQHAFENAGLTPRDNELDRAIAKYLNSGGTIEGAQARLNVAAARMPGMSQCCSASDGLGIAAQTRQPIEDARGQVENVRKDPMIVASPSSSNRGGEGQDQSAHKSQTMHASPVREPSESYLKAAGESRMEAARSILYRFHTSTGKLWADVHPYEGVGMQRDSIRYMALMSVLGPLNPKRMKMTFGELMTPRQAQIAMHKADKELVNVA